MSDAERDQHQAEAVMPDMEALLVDRNESLMHDPTVKTVSIRRHGPYNRGAAEGESQLKGQLTKKDGSFESVNAAAQEWVDSLPEDVNIEIIASPTNMPAERPLSDEAQERHPNAKTKITPRRASLTSGLYAEKLRERFAPKYQDEDPERVRDVDETEASYWRLASDDLSPRLQEALEGGTRPESVNTRRLDQRLGDIFEYTTEEESQHIGKFFGTLSKTYDGGMGNPDFWPDFIRGNLPKELNDAYLAAGGDMAVEKAALALEVIGDFLKKPEGDKKEVALLLSHEEVIGSLAYQIQEYLRDRRLADDETIAALDANKFSYNEGFDIHVDNNGKATFEIIGFELKDIDLEDLKQYIAEKVDAQVKE